MTQLQFFEEKLKGVSPFTKKNYSVYIRLLDTKLGSKVASRAELYEIMNTIIADYDKDDGRSGLMARSAFIKLLKLHGIPSSDANDALIKVKEKERRILKKWVSFGIIKKISNNCNDSTLQLIIMTQYETCSRIEDILNLKVNNIDFEDGVIRMTTMKTGISKVNALTKHTLEMLRT